MMRTSLLATATTALALLASGPALAQQQFDGRWSVEIVTESGTCDRVYRYPVIVENGRVRYGGPEAFQVSGRIAANGSVQGSIARGENRADVRGRVSGNTGSGTWRAAGARNCSGRWNAEKRS
jgi:hypothetical protein